MKVIIAGSRYWKDINTIEYLWRRLEEEEKTKITVVLSGRCRGADTLGEEVATAHGVPVDPYPADWEKHGKSAGPIRNQEMANNADALILVWDGKSSGSLDMYKRAKKKGITVYTNVDLKI